MELPLVLGTAQLGLPYGIANASGKPSQADANALVQAAWEGGVVFYDTAMAYGESERVLGQAFQAAGICRPNVITKLSPDMGEANAAEVAGSLENALLRLGLSRLYALFLHREEQLPLLDGEIGRALHDCVAAGQAGSIGVSVYTTTGAAAALRHPLVGCVQVPSSLFDRRFENAGIFELARELGKEIHIRSVLLQGVMAMTPDKLPPFLLPLKSCLTAFHAVCTRYALEPAPLALAWAMRRYPHAKILFGAERAEQVCANLSFLGRRNMIPARVWEDMESLFPPQLPQLLNPSNWK